MEFATFGWKFRAKGQTVIVLSHESSRCVLGWFSCAKIASLLLKVEPGSLVATEIKPGKKVPKVQNTYIARWVGKPGGGLDELRLEYKLRIDAITNWEKVL